MSTASNLTTEAKQLRLPMRESGIYLVLRRSFSGEIAASICKGKSCYSFVFTYSKLEDTRIHWQFEDDPSLWIGRTAFDIRPKDVDKISKAFAIRIEGENPKKQVAA